MLFENSTAKGVLVFTSVCLFLLLELNMAAEDLRVHTDANKTCAVNTIIHVELELKGKEIVIIGAYVPCNNTLELEKVRFFNELTNLLDNIGNRFCGKMSCFQ